jgi:hypothetical protein
MTYEIGTACKYKSLDDIAKLIKAGDIIALAAGETSQMATRGIHLASIVKVVLKGTGARHTVKILTPGVAAFSAGKGCVNPEIHDVQVDVSAGGFAFDCGGAVGMKCYNVGAIGQGRLFNLTGGSGFEAHGYDCRTSSDYGIYCGAASGDGKSSGPADAVFEDGTIVGSFLHGFRAHRTRNLRVSRLLIDNNNPSGHTGFSVKEFGPIFFDHVQTLHKDNALGPLGAGQKLDPDWQTLALNGATLTECTFMDCPNWGLDLEAGVSGLSMTGGTIATAPKGQCAVNCRPAFNGVDAAGHPLPVPSGTPAARLPAMGVFRGVKFNAPVIVKGASTGLKFLPS